MIEMYADPTSRGGIMEPQGLVNVKMKTRHYDSLMRRLLPNLSDEQEKNTLEPTFLQLAVHFADLHDTPGRMLAKGVIKGIVPLRNARRVLGMRLARRLIEVEERVEANDMVECGYVDDGSDSSFVQFYNNNRSRIECIVKSRRLLERRRELQAELEALDKQIT